MLSCNKDDNQDYMVNIINNKTLTNQINIEILAKNRKKNQKDIKLFVESELITTVIEINTKLNETKRTTIRTKLMPTISTNIEATKMAKKKKLSPSDKENLQIKRSKNQIKNEKNSSQSIAHANTDSNISSKKSNLLIEHKSNKFDGLKSDKK